MRGTCHRSDCNAAILPAVLNCRGGGGGSKTSLRPLARPQKTQPSARSPPLAQMTAAMRQPGVAAALGMGSPEEAAGAVALLQLRLEHLAYELIRAAYLDEAETPPLVKSSLAGPSVATGAAGRGYAGGSAAGSGYRSRSGSSSSPGHRGEEMMALLMSVPAAAAGRLGCRGSSLLPAANARFGLDASAARAMKQVGATLQHTVQFPPHSPPTHTCSHLHSTGHRRPG